MFVYMKMTGGSERDIVNTTSKMANLIIPFSIISWIIIIGLVYMFDLLGFFTVWYLELKLLMTLFPITGMFIAFILFSRLIGWVWKLLSK